MPADEVLITGEIVRDERGRLTLDVTDEAKRFLARAVGNFKKEGPCTVTVKAGREPKSIKQLRRIHAIFREIGEETGNRPEDVKDELKRKFLARSVEFTDLETGEMTSRVQVPSLADLTMDEMRDFMSHVELWAGEWLSMTFDHEPEAAA